MRSVRASEGLWLKLTTSVLKTVVFDVSLRVESRRRRRGRRSRPILFAEPARESAFSSSSATGGALLAPPPANSAEAPPSALPPTDSLLAVVADGRTPLPARAHALLVWTPQEACRSQNFEDGGGTL